MADQSRVWKVLIALLASMTLGTVVLMGLGNHAPVSGAFSLASYYQLTPLDEAIAANGPLQVGRWQRIEIAYSQTRSGDIRTLAILAGLPDPSAFNAHFVVCNGADGRTADGQIQTTARWLAQQPIRPKQDWGHAQKTIGILVVAEGSSRSPTDTQMRRVSALVEALRNRLQIPQANVQWPGESD